MLRETTSPRERYLAVLNRKKTDRIPTDYWATEETTNKLLKHLNLSDVWQMYDKLHIDKIIGVGAAYKGPKPETGYDIYGCRYQIVDYGSGVYSECVYNPLAKYNSKEEIMKNYTWPSIDWFDFSVIPDQIKGKEKYPVQGGGSEPFLTYCHLRGIQQAYIDLLENTEIVEYCLDKLVGFNYENTARIYEQIPGKVVFSYVAEDYGSQESLLFSRAILKKFFLPHMKKMIDLVHNAGAFAFFHSDGAVREIIPDMIEIGIDVLNPIQWRCHGMEREELKRDFGDKVIFHGGVDNQQTLPFGSVEDVREEVIYNMKVLGKNGGYILAPCHNIQSVTPPENIVAMYKAVIEFYR